MKKFNTLLVALLISTTNVASYACETVDVELNLEALSKKYNASTIKHSKKHELSHKNVNTDIQENSSRNIKDKATAKSIATQLTSQDNNVKTVTVVQEPFVKINQPEVKQDASSIKMKQPSYPSDENKSNFIQNNNTDNQLTTKPTMKVVDQSSDQFLPPVQLNKATPVLPKQEDTKLSENINIVEKNNQQTMNVQNSQNKNQISMPITDNTSNKVISNTEKEKPVQQTNMIPAPVPSTTNEQNAVDVSNDGIFSGIKNIFSKNTKDEKVNNVDIPQQKTLNVKENVKEQPSVINTSKQLTDNITSSTSNIIDTKKSDVEPPDLPPLLPLQNGDQKATLPVLPLDKENNNKAVNANLNPNNTTIQNSNIDSKSVNQVSVKNVNDQNNYGQLNNIVSTETVNNQDTKLANLGVNNTTNIVKQDSDLLSNTLTFDATATSLNPTQQNLLKNIISTANNTDIRYNVASYSSASSVDNQDRKISLQRVVTTRKFLIDNGVKAENIQVQALGNLDNQNKDVVIITKVN